MRLVTYLLLGFALHVSASGISQKVSFSGKQVPVKKVFSAIKEQAGFVFFYDADVLQQTVPVSVNLHDVKVEELLAACLQQQSQAFEYTIRDKTIFITRKQLPAEATALPPEKMPEAAADEILVKGQVVAENGGPLGFVYVRIKGAPRGTNTDKDGRFSITVQRGFALEFSYVGFVTREIKITSDKYLLVTMELDKSTALSDLVVATGYQQIERRYLTGSVTSLKGDSILVPGINTLDKLLEGRVPGMIFMQNSGQVGATPRLRIRGTSSIIGSQEPLWVLNGIPLTDPVNVSPSKLNDLDFVNLLGNAISGLNPADIEQIDVLKDAATTALYGTRAANGVISITTKKGKPGPPQISYSVSGTYSRRPRYTDRAVYMMNSRDRVDVSREMFEKGMVYNNVTAWTGYEKAVIDYNNGIITYAEFKRQVDKYETMNTDWLGIVGQDALSTAHTISLSGGSANVRYYGSLGYADEQGTIKNESAKRYTSNINITADYRKFTVQFGLQANVNNGSHNPTDIGVLNYAYNMNRAINAYNDDGSLYYYPRVSTATTTAIPFNILNEMNNSRYLTNVNSTNLTARLDYKITREFRVSGTINYTISNAGERTWYTDSSYYIKDLTRQGVASSTLAPIGGELTTNDIKGNAYTYRLMGNYNKRFGAHNQHLIDVTGGGEMSSTKSYGYNLRRRGYSPARGEVFLAINPSSYRAYASWLTGISDPLALGVITDQLNNVASGYATVTYGYKDKYIFNVNSRIDASNQFGANANGKKLPVWSSSARWDIKNDVLKNAKWVNMLALKATFGYQGNMVANQSSQMTIVKGNYSSVFNEYYSSIKYYPNPDLRWEKTTSTNYELDFAILNNKLSGSVAYYRNYTKDAFLTKTVSVINGTETYVVNGGNITNQGVELTLSITPVNNLRTTVRGKRAGFVWRFDPQLGSAINQLINKAIKKSNLSLSNTITYSDMLNGSAQFAGKSLGTFYSYKFAGLNHADGTPVFYGAEDANSTKLDQQYSGMNKQDVYFAVMTESGTRTPTLQGGISNYLGYGQFGLSFNITYSLGNKVRLMKLASGYGTNTPYPQANLRQEYVNRWRKPGDEQYTSIPGLTANSNTNNPWWTNKSYAFADNSIYAMYDQSDLRVVSGNYLKMQSLSFAYNFEQALCNKVGLKSGYISLAGSNLFILANKNLRGQDPSQSGSSPNINLSVYPTYSFNVNVTF